MLIGMGLSAPKASGRDDPPPLREVLLIHSYQPDVEYTRLQDSAIRSALEQDYAGPLHFSTDYLELKGIDDDPVYKDHLYRFLNYKLAGRTIDLVITTDTPAVAFLLEFGANLLPNVPIVFSGVRIDFPTEKLHARDMTGVVESVDIRRTMNLAMQLHPDTRRILMISDESVYGRQLRALAEEQMAGLKFSGPIIWLDKESLDGLFHCVRASRSDDLIFFLAHDDPRGWSSKPPFSLISQICRLAHAPVYACYDAYLGSGIVGGKMASGSGLGRVAGQMAARVLRGERAADIPIVVGGGSAPYMFDARALKRFNLDRTRLPPGSEVLFDELSFFERFKTYIMIGGFFVIAQGGVILLLLISNARRRHIQSVLRNERDVLDTVMRATPAAILVLDASDRITYANRHALELFGQSGGSMVGSRWTDANEWSLRNFDGSDIPLTQTPLVQIEKTGEAVHGCEFSCRRGDGPWIDLCCSGTPIKDAVGGITSVVFTLEDISQRRAHEKALEQARNELETRVRDRTHELLDANKQLRRAIRERHMAESQSRKRQDELAHVQRLATMGEMATGLAHEINQPLAAIATYTQGCIRRLDAPEVDRVELRRAMAEVAAQAQRAGEIIRRIRGFLKKEKPQSLHVSPNDIARNAVAMIHADARAAAVELRLDLTETVAPVQVDSIQLEQVILNVLRNGIEAVKCRADGPRRVRVATRDDHPGRIIIEVADSGPGIGHEVRDRVFEPFFTTKSTGLGMGLAISRSIIEAHGGHMAFVVPTDIGATVRITLPAAYAPRLPPDNEPASESCFTNPLSS